MSSFQKGERNHLKGNRGISLLKVACYADDIDTVRRTTSNITILFQSLEKSDIVVQLKGTADNLFY